MPPTRRLRSKRYLLDNTDTFAGGSPEPEELVESAIEEEPPTRCLRSKNSLLAHTSKFATETRDPASRFLDLPAELRNRIYSLLLEDENPLQLGYEDKQRKHLTLKSSKKTPKAHLHPEILLTCHQINSEATPILYGNNTFSFNHGSTLDVPSILSHFPSSIKYIRHISLYITSLVGLERTCEILGAAKDLKSFEISGQRGGGVVVCSDVCT